MTDDIIERAADGGEPKSATRWANLYVSPGGLPGTVVGFTYVSRERAEERADKDRRIALVEIPWPEDAP